MEAPAGPEGVRGAKEWPSRHCSRWTDRSPSNPLPLPLLVRARDLKYAALVLVKVLAWLITLVGLVLIPQGAALVLTTLIILSVASVRSRRLPAASA